MSTVQEIERAIDSLPHDEREVLESRLLARRFGLEALNDAERAELNVSLDEAERDMDNGESHTADELRQAVRKWAGA